MKDRPNISGIVPVKDGANWIPYFLDHIRENLIQTDEMIFVDDSSSDETFSLLENAQYKESNIVVLKNPGKGIVSALNFGISEARHNLIARFDIDDTYAPFRIQKQIEAIGTEHGVCFSDYSFCGNGVSNLGYIASAIHPLSMEISLSKSQRTAHPIALFRKEVFNEAGGYLDEDFPAEDLGLWFRMAKIATLVSVPEELLFYNLRASSTSSQKRTSALLKKNSLVRENLNLYRHINRNFDSIFAEYESYESHSHSFERKLHLLREMLELGDKVDLHSNYKKKLLLELGRLLLSFGNLVELQRMNQYRKMRINLRKKL